jgi:hypothetical protein
VRRSKEISGRRPDIRADDRAEQADRITAWRVQDLPAASRESAIRRSEALAGKPREQRFRTLRASVRTPLPETSLIRKLLPDGSDAVASGLCQFNGANDQTEDRFRRHTSRLRTTSEFLAALP